MPSDRVSPQNIYLTGQFQDLKDIVLEDNVNFSGKDALLIGSGGWSIFKTDTFKSYSEMYSQFFIDDTLFTDYISLRNVTFQGLHFKQPPIDISTSISNWVFPRGSYAIFGANFNGSGWEIQDNLSIFDCEFEGFTNAVCVQAVNSEYRNNYFHDNYGAGLFFPYGLNLTVEGNTFDTLKGLTTENKQWLSVGLYCFDVFDGANISNNTFNSGTDAFGIVILSCQRNILVSNNVFTGGNAFLIDFVERPFFSYDIVFQDNFGVENFVYNEGLL